MQKALRLQEQMALEKFESLNIVDRRRVLFALDDMAKQKGYSGEHELKKKRPYIWNQMCAQVIREKFK